MQNLTPPPDLKSRILQQIEQEKQLSRLKRKLIFNAGFFILSWAGLVFAAEAFLAAAGNSGFIIMLRLAFSDFKVIAINFTDYALSLVESLPIVSMAVVAALLLPALLSFLKFVTSIYDIRRIYKVEKI